MLLNDVNLIIIFFFFIIFSIIINVNSSLHLLLTAEILWVTLYGLALTVGLIFDNLNLLALTFFFLVFSAIELGVGLILLLLQNLINRSILLYNETSNVKKFLYRFKTKLYINKFTWK